jgi:RES domain-containing protein
MRIVYLSFSKSLAALETLIHLKLPVTSKYVAIRVEFHDALVEVLPTETLPAGWNVEPPPVLTQQIGDRWARDARSAVLAVPGVITGETNYLLNPEHADFKKIARAKPEPFTFDVRLLA